ncbi:DHHC palmitoyltransferase-domain-containing protein [Apodospora peruviana]|uniref:Palmitoyltransferase n=1 Tax=Apodospora peruviana TaxID=516989 RepID=A0AAE0MHF9_9PEZI|nr:DHHC palmitoyltransferase-domain-containing protein [Apodospora peruviana]
MVEARRASTRWATRVIPFVLAGFVGFASYVVVKRICLDFFLDRQQQSGTAVAFLVVYSVFLFLALVSYARVWAEIQRHPGAVPLGPNALNQRKPKKKGRRKSRAHREDDIEAKAYDSRPDSNPDSPGLEAFYSRDVFVCKEDGLPRWCSTCCNWKPDRAHHCSELERCVLKMDHFCPWVGGIVGETSFKFFIQFTFYAAIYWAVVIIAAAYGLSSSINSGAGVDGFFIAALAIGAFFELFTFTMTGTAVRYICINLTNVDYLKSKVVVHYLALRVPRGTPPGHNYGVVTYPLQELSASAPSPQLSGQTITDEHPASARDQLAKRTFAIIKTEMGENPWDLGPYRNWKSIMGSNIIDWLLPFNPSPCSDGGNSESLYELGPLYPKLRARYNLPDISDEATVISSGDEMKEKKKPRQEEEDQTGTNDDTQASLE